MVSEDAVRDDTRRAFDRAAADYDGPTGNNVVIQRMRARMWQRLLETFPAGGRLLDLGCGTGIDAAYVASRGYSVLATDSSSAMVERTHARLVENGLEHRASTRVVGLDELHLLHGETFDGIYSDLGPFNCATDLHRTAHACASLLRPGSCIVASVIGRICPWEMVYYIVHGDWKRASLRWETRPVPVPMQGETVWTRYFTPRQFYSAFAGEFELTSYQGLRICSPPPYMLGVEKRLRPVCALGEWLDDHIGGLSPIRNAGDHFLMTLTRRTGDGQYGV
jgi:SAM-dependent methyltransferase